ncbi:hypothetical protein CWB99_07865 [Pseudoalteromonas rubra]|uniref:DUF3108 domain-containing protein n=1 Tax=Pseudoalteromonas rubra TaxID=43658 RepID=A0A5S3WQ45_9GAMM|nr:hypothetical protein [Pseudoalteromonas rubra]TMP29518.1 hypothetical protein CWB99_07865 [Pseudoalteromonas rubra]TMP35112.1 hypothetical protein CWC00_04830 [Pseudoalteromonas rubra]
MKYYIVKMCFFVVLLLWECEAFAELPVQVSKSGDYYFTLNVQLGNGTFINNIIFKREKINDRWLLQVRSDYQLAIEGRNSLRMTEYEELLHLLFEFIETQPLGNSVDRIQLDLGLVEDTQARLSDSLRSLVTTKKGVVSHKDKDVFKVVLNNLAGSELVSNTCKLVTNYKMRCDKPIVIGMNPIAFKSEFIGKPWSVLSSQEKIGLSEGLWFAVRLKPLDRE